MPKLTLSDRASLREFEREALAVLNDLALKWNCSVIAAGGSFNKQEVTCRWTFTPSDEDGVIEKAAFAQHAFLFGLKPEDYGRLLTHPDGTKLMLVGFNMKRRKYPIILRPVLGGSDRDFVESVLKRLEPKS